MELLVTLLALIALHAVFVSAEYAFVKTAHSDILPLRDTLLSTMSAAICRQLEDYLTVCALARTIILMSIGVLLGLFVNDLGGSNLHDLAAVSWRQWAQFGLGFSTILLVQLVIGFELPKVLAIRRTLDCTEALGWHLIISQVILWPLLWLVNRLKRYTYYFV